MILALFICAERFGNFSCLQDPQKATLIKIAGVFFDIVIQVTAVVVTCLAYISIIHLPPTVYKITAYAIPALTVAIHLPFWSYVLYKENQQITQRLSFTKRY